MKALLFILFFALVCACSCPCYLKEGQMSTMDLLTRKTWYLAGDYQIRIKCKYSKRTAKEQFKVKDGSARIVSSYEYFLSDSIEKTFKPDKVGKYENGSYIIGKKMAAKILTLNCDTLITLAIHLDSMIYIGGNKPMLYVSKRPY